MNNDLDRIVKYGDSSRSHRRQVPLIWLTLAFALTAETGCTRAKPVPFPDIHYENSKTKYHLLVVPDEKIGSLEKVGINVLYVVLNNRSCMPMDYTLAPGGIHPQPGKNYYPKGKIDAGKITVEIPESIAKDEDYYGLGLCRWGIHQITVNITTDRSKVAAALARPEIERVRHSQYCSLRTGMCGLDRLSSEQIKASWPSISVEINKE